MMKNKKVIKQKLIIHLYLVKNKKYQKKLQMINKIKQKK